MEAQSEKAFIKKLLFGACVVISFQCKEEENSFPCCVFP